LTKIALRIDDIGASTKQFEIYSKSRFGNFLCLKYLKFFRAWGPYREMELGEWKQVFKILKKYGARLTVCVTAAWVEKDGGLIPFPEKFPREAEILKNGFKDGLLEIANHGLTHCVVGKHLPRLFSSNRKYHREFWDWIPREIHFKHIETSQKILQDWIGEKITTLIPPGNVYSADTLEAAEENGIKMINSYKNLHTETLVKIIDEANVIAFHDRELILESVGWLERKLESLPSETEYFFVRDL
jgi:peptidoglycan/xylan/chitin deacetylase (PgdA/CDA1 family)